MKRKVIIIGFIILGALSLLNIFPDPYHREGNVNFWVWLYREVDELIFGEKG